MERSDLCFSGFARRLFILSYVLRLSNASSIVFFSTCLNDCYWTVIHRSSAYIMLLVPLWISGSLVYILNRVGASTLPCGRSFYCFLHLMRSLFSSTYNLLLDSKFWMTLQSLLSYVVLLSFCIRSIWFTVSYDAYRTTNAVSVIFPFWYPSSMCGDRFNS